MASALKSCLRKNPTTDESAEYLSDGTTPITTTTMDDGNSKKILSVSAFKIFPPSFSLFSLYALSIVYPAEWWNEVNVT